MSKKLILSAVIVSAIGLTGCATTPLDYKTGTQITQEQLSTVKAGATQAEIVSKFGQPSKKTPLNGKEAWYYDYQKIGALFGGNVNESTVFEFDNSGKLLQSYKTGGNKNTGNALLDAANK